MEAVEAGQFHVWAVDSIDDGIEVLTGVKAGKRRDDGSYEEGTVNCLVNERLEELAEMMRKFGRAERDEEMSA